MGKQFSFICLSFVAALMGACTEESVLRQNESDAGIIDFIMSAGDAASTRTSTQVSEMDVTTSFVAEDCVGVFAVNADQDICANNLYKATSSDGTLTWNTSAPIKVEDAPTAFYAYYPYAEGNNNKSSVSHTILGSQDSENDYNQSDLLTAVLTGQSFSGSENQTVTLQYSHQLALVQVKVFVGDKTEAPRYVKLLDIKPTVTVDLTAQTSPMVTTVDNASPIEVFMYQVSSELSAEDDNYVLYRAVVPAQTIEVSNAILEFVLDGKIYRMTHASEVVYKSGKIRNITVQAAGAAPQISIDTKDNAIDNWENDSEHDISDGAAEFVGEAPKEIGSVATMTSIFDINSSSDKSDYSLWPDADFTGWYLKSGKKGNTIILDNVQDNGVTYNFSNTNGNYYGLYYFFGPCLKKEGISKYKLNFTFTLGTQTNGELTLYNKAICAIFNYKAVEGAAFPTLSSFASTEEKNETFKQYSHSISVDGEKYLVYGINPITTGEISCEFDLTKIRTSDTWGETQDWTTDYDNLVIGFIGFQGQVTISSVSLEPVTE